MRDTGTDRPQFHCSLFQRDEILALLLFTLTFVSRIPFQSRYLYHWDSVNFAYAMQEFNVALEQPQPPGYILYVWLCRGVDVFFRNPQQTMVTISIIASALAVVALFFLGSVIFNRMAGLLAALFLASSPLVWFYGEIALPHVLDALLVVICAYGLYRTMQGEKRFLYPSIVALAVTGGVRQQTLVFLLPLSLFALRKVGLKKLLFAILLGIGFCLAWFVPLVQLNGGLTSYLQTVSAFSNRFQSSTSVFQGGGLWGIRRNLLKLALYTGYGWSLAAVPAIAVVVAIWKRACWKRNWEKMVFFVLWIFPPLLYYVLVHMGQQGLVFVFLPALFLISGVGVQYLFRTMRGRGWLTTGIVAINLVVFLFVPEYPWGTGNQRLLTYDTLRNSDRYYDERFSVIEKNFTPQKTILLAANWHHVKYYLPAYSVIPFEIGGKWEIDEGIPQFDAAQALEITSSSFATSGDQDSEGMVIMFDPELVAFNHSAEFTKTVPLANGDTLPYLVISQHNPLVLKEDGFELQVSQ